MAPETPATLLARIDQRLLTVEREVGEIKAEQRYQREAVEKRKPAWPTIGSFGIAAAALLITLIQNIR